MMQDWLPGFVRVNNDRWNGQTFDAGYPGCIVMHSMEGYLTITGAQVHESPPHFWIAPKRKQKIQTVRLNRGSYAMGSDTPSPNRKTNCIQIECEGFANSMATDLTEEDYRWIGEEVIGPIYQEFVNDKLPFDLKGAPDASTEQIGGSASEFAPQRFSKEKWLVFNSLCGHRHVWDQGDRYDPGLMDLRKVLSYVDSNLGPAESTTPNYIKDLDDDMMRFLIDTNGTVYAVDGIKAYPISNDYTRQVMQKAGVLMTKEQMIASKFEWNIDRGSITTAFVIGQVIEAQPDTPF